MSLLAVNGLTVRYGEEEVVSGLSFSLRAIFFMAVTPASGVSKVAARWA